MSQVSVYLSSESALIEKRGEGAVWWRVEETREKDEEKRQRLSLSDSLCDDVIVSHEPRG